MLNNIGNTNFTGHDNRYQNMAFIGRVADRQADDVSTNARVIRPDQQDYITKQMPIMQTSASGKRSFAMPRKGANVVCLKLPNGTADGVVLGTFYTTSDPPPVSDPNLDFTEYDDGSTMSMNASTGQLDWNLKGAMNMTTGQPVTIKADKIILIGDVEIQGNLKVTGKIDADDDISTTATLYDYRGKDHN
jgi:phage baseplate assembly protein V